MTYLEYQGPFQRLRLRYFRKVLRHFGLKEGMRFLDYGCGPGDMLQVAQAAGLESYGIDNAEYSVELARQRGLTIHLGDYESMDFPPAFFDAIFLQSVLEHVHDPLALVDGLRSYLAEDGLLILSAPTPGSFFWDDPTHIRPYTPKSFRTLAQVCGFEVVEINYVFAFLMGLRLENAFFYKLMNVQPLPLGSNLIGAFRKRGAAS